MSYTTTKMDKFVANTIKEVLSNGVKSEGGRPVYKSDGAPAESYYITDVFVKFDLSKGELPISSLRPVYTGLSRQEMLWIYQDQTSDLKALRERGVMWWDDWGMTKQETFYQDRDIREVKIPILDESIYIDSYDGPRTCQGIGYNSPQNKNEEQKKIYSLWYSMLERVNNRHRYSNTKIQASWLDYNIFEKEIKLIPGYIEAKKDNFKGWVLDKDYFGLSSYGIKSSVFLTEDENKLYQSTSTPIKALNKSNGKIKYFLKQEDAALFFNVHRGTISKWLSNGTHLKDNWEISKFISNTHVLRIASSIEGEENIGLRYGATIKKWNLMNKLLDGLEKTPFSRRHIINMWQEDDLQWEANLPECAFEVLFDVRKVNGEMYLDASLTQRSSDFVVAGMGINQIQYVALQMMIAKKFGWKLGTFSWHVMNLHIYDRHIDNAKILLERYNTSTPDSSPIEFYLDVPDGTDFYDMKAEDFKMKGYKAIGSQLEFDMAL